MDYAKGIAIILVAYRHVLIGLDRSGLEIHPYLMNLNEIFYSFRMPLFFILSGVFISQSLKKRSLKEMLKIKWETLLYPYLVWCLIQITLQILFKKYTNSQRGPIDYAYILIQPDRIDQLWYLFALFNVTICYLFFKVVLKLNTLQQLALGLIFYYLSLSLDTGPQHDILYYYIYYSIGDMISSTLLNKQFLRYFSSEYLSLIIIPFFVFSQWYFVNHLDMQYVHIFEFSIIALIGCLFMINICFVLQKHNILNWLRIVGYHSLYIYVMQVIVASAARSFFVDIIGIKSTPILLAIDLPLSIAICIILYNLAMRWKLWFLFSLNKKEEFSSNIPLKLFKSGNLRVAGNKHTIPSSKPL